MQAGSGPGEASARIPSCCVQLPRRNAGLLKALARGGVQTFREKQIPPRRLGLNRACAMVESDKVTPLPENNSISFLLPHQHSSASPLLNIALSVWSVLERQTLMSSARKESRVVFVFVHLTADYNQVLKTIFL